MELLKTEPRKKKGGRYTKVEGRGSQKSVVLGKQNSAFAALWADERSGRCSSGTCTLSGRLSSCCDVSGIIMFDVLRHIQGSDIASG